MKYQSMSIFSFLCLGCSDPFTVDRHALTEARIIGVRKDNGAYVAQVWNGTAVFHSQSPEITWFDASESELGQGAILVAQTSVPARITYTDLKGSVHQANFLLEEQDASFPISLESIESTENYLLEDRLAQSESPITDNISTEQVRLRAEVGEDSQMRWMTTQGIGSFLELDRETTDFYWKDILLDRDELVEDTEIVETYSTIFALSIDQEGHNQWQWLDLWRESSESLLRHQNRLLPIGLEIAEESEIVVTVEVVDSLFGFAFSDAEVVDSNTELPASLSCALAAAAFQWWWVETGICLLEDLDGQRILLQVSP